MMRVVFATYIMASRRNGTLYVGVTRELCKRVYEHKNKLVDGFTKKHNISMLVFYQVHASAEEAIYAEKKLKRLSRSAKLNLIEANNPYWHDLYKDIF